MCYRLVSDDTNFRRLAGMMARLDSPFDGERAAAALLLSRQLQRLRLSWFDAACAIQVHCTDRARPANVSLAEIVARWKLRRNGREYRGPIGWCASCQNQEGIAPAIRSASGSLPGSRP